MVGVATRTAFRRAVDLCINEQVDAFIVAGDLYDGSLRSMKTASYFGEEMRRLTEAGIHAFIMRGNHDAESIITRELTLPEGVHVFSKADKPAILKDGAVAVHGYAGVVGLIIAGFLLWGAPSSPYEGFATVNPVDPERPPNPNSWCVRMADATAVVGASAPAWRSRPGPRWPHTGSAGSATSAAIATHPPR